MLRALRSLVRERAPVGSLRRTRPTAAERSGSWRRKQQRGCADPQRAKPPRPEDSGGPDGRSVQGDTCSEPLLPSRAAADPAGKRTRLCSLTSELEAQLQRLNFAEEGAGRAAERGATPPGDDQRAAEKRRGSGLRQSPGGDGLDLGGLLERDFSVQSMTSMINEDCFYDAMMGIQTTAVPTLQG